jgi:hypothetical protein
LLWLYRFNEEQRRERCFQKRRLFFHRPLVPATFKPGNIARFKSTYKYLFFVSQQTGNANKK